MYYFKIWFSIAISCVFCYQLAAQKKYNLDLNQFDETTQKMPKGWFTWGYHKDITGEILPDGNIVGKISAESKNKFGCIMYRIPANFTGDTVTLTARIKFENVKDYVGLIMRTNDYARNTLDFNSMQFQKIRGTSDWKTYRISMPFNDRAKYLNIGGILGKKGTAWFDDFKVSIDGVNIENLKEEETKTLSNTDVSNLDVALKNESHSFDIHDTKSLDPLLKAIGNKRIVAIGESTHGTGEYYKIRKLITQRLIEEKGFELVVLENPYDEIEMLNEQLNSQPLDSLIYNHLFSIYQTQEMKSFLDWYKGHKSSHHIELKGCDDSFWVLDELLSTAFSGTKDEKIIKWVNDFGKYRKRSENSSFKKDMKYGVKLYEILEGLEQHLINTDMLTEKWAMLLTNGKNSYINNVRLSNGENIKSRDAVMAERISYLANTSKKKIIIWAHNAHISKKVVVDKEIGIMGRDLLKEFGSDYFAIALSTLSGTHSCIERKGINTDSNFNVPLKKAKILQNDGYTWEKKFAEVGPAWLLNITDLNQSLDLDIIGSTQFIGYNKGSKWDWYALPLLTHFDAFVFMENTQATIPLFNEEQLTD